jgi:hypothetical protein
MVKQNRKGEGINMSEQTNNNQNQNPELGRDGNLGFHQVGSSPTGGALE